MFYLVYVQVPPSSPNVQELSKKKIQNSDANSEVPETQTSQQPFKSDLTSTSAAEVSDKNTRKGFTFTFPIPNAPVRIEDRKRVNWSDILMYAQRAIYTRDPQTLDTRILPLYP